MKRYCNAGTVSCASSRQYRNSGKTYLFKICVPKTLTLFPLGDSKTKRFKCITATCDDLWRLHDPFAGATVSWNKPAKYKGDDYCFQLKTGDVFDAYLESQLSPLHKY